MLNIPKGPSDAMVFLTLCCVAAIKKPTAAAGNGRREMKREEGIGGEIWPEISLAFFRFSSLQTSDESSLCVVAARTATARRARIVIEIENCSSKIPKISKIASKSKDS